MPSTAPLTTMSDAVVLRVAGAPDDRALRDLAALDSAHLGPGPHLVAEVGGELRAAVSLSDGSSVADPFHATAAYVELLHARAGAVAPGSDRRRHRARVTAAIRPAAA